MSEEKVTPEEWVKAFGANQRLREVLAEIPKEEWPEFAKTEEPVNDAPKKKCEAGRWTSWTGQEGDCPNDATHIEFWFDEEGVEVALCDEHDRNRPQTQVGPRPE